MQLFRNRRSVWDKAVASGDTEAWAKYARELDGFDLFPFITDFGRLREFGNSEEEVPLSTWINHLFSLGERKIRELSHEAKLPMRERLPLVSYLIWAERMKDQIRRAGTAGAHTGEGVFAYYTDLMQLAILASFTVTGEAVVLHGGLAIPQPHAYLDPVQALQSANTREQVEVIKQALASPTRLVAQRNVLIAVNRADHQGVFGPTIDTLFLNDWIFVNCLADRAHFDRKTEEVGPIGRFLEIGTGNGLISATIARNAAPRSSLDCVDIDVRAVLCTDSNVRLQPSAGILPYFYAGPFEANRHPREFDLIVSNPPYIPYPDHLRNRREGSPLHVATHGTDLIVDMLNSAPRLLNRNGRLVMVASTLASPEIAIAADQTALSIEAVASRRVRFDIDAISPQHLEWLKDERGLEETEGLFFHEIAIFVATDPTAAELHTDDDTNGT